MLQHNILTTIVMIKLLQFQSMRIKYRHTLRFALMLYRTNKSADALELIVRNSSPVAEVLVRVIRGKQTEF